MTPSKQRQIRLHRLPWVLGLCLALASPAPVWADLYTWVDDRGVQNIVDNLTRVPGRFRRQARRFMTPSASRGTENPSTSLPRAESRGSGLAPVEPAPVSGSAEPLGLSGSTELAEVSGRRLAVEAPAERSG